MGIFEKLFGLIGGKNTISNNNEDKTPYKIKVMNRSLSWFDIEAGNRLCRVKVPKYLDEKYIEALRKKAKSLELTSSEKTHLYGYLNPGYRFATYPKKHIRGKRSK